MDIRHLPPKQKICLKHNQPVVMFHSDPKIGACCFICIQNLTGMTPAEQIFNQQHQIYDKAQQKIDENHQLLKSFLNFLLIYKENIVSSLDKIKQLILDQIENLNQQLYQLDLIFKSDSNQQKLSDDLEYVYNSQEKFNKDIKDQLHKQLQGFLSKFSDIGKLLTIIGKNEEQENEVTIKMKNQLKSQSMPKKIQYELIKESNLKQNNPCYAFAFNKDNSILVVACLNEIIIYEFIKGYISKETQRLQNHTSTVVCLYFMRNSNSFVSGSFDNLIIIWVLDQNNNYIVQQVLKEPKHIYCIVMNKSEDQIIAGSCDKFVKNWKKVSGSWTCQQRINTEDIVRNMCLNEVEDKLIVCQNHDKSSIQILFLQKDQKWKIVQTLDFSGCVQRLCFTIGDQFVMQNRTSNSLEIYDYDTNQNEFKAVAQVQMQQIQYCADLFPCQFVKSLNILTFKHGEFLNIFKVNENYKYELMQVIQYGNYFLYGRVTDEGQYLVTYDTQLNKIQIRQIKYLE